MADNETKVESKVAGAVAEGVDPNQAVNVVGEVKRPEDNASEEEWRAYFKQIDAKLDKLIAKAEAGKPDPIVPEDKPEPKKPKKSLIDETLEA